MRPVVTRALKSPFTIRTTRYHRHSLEVAGPLCPYFMNRVVTAYPDKEIHVVIDNLSTHKPKRDMWLARHKNVHFHYTPTHSSW